MSLKIRKKVVVDSLASRLTNSDKGALLDCHASASENKEMRVYGLGRVISHYRWFRLLAAGAVENIPPRMTKDGYLTAQIIKQIGPV